MLPPVNRAPVDRSSDLIIAGCIHLALLLVKTQAVLFPFEPAKFQDTPYPQFGVIDDCLIGNIKDRYAKRLFPVRH